MQVLVTGGTGFVGSHIVQQLLDAGHRVRVLVRNPAKASGLPQDTVEIASGSLSDADALNRACEGVDWVFHVAAMADYWRVDQSQMMDINVEGTRRVLQAAQVNGVQRVIFTSSAAAIGMRADGQPADESIAFNLRPDQFVYGYSKALAEQMVADFVAAGVDVVTVNPSVVMGPGDLNVISGSFIMQIKRLGRLVPVTSGGIGVTDVRDVARWHIVAAERGQRGERYILNTANYSYKDWYGMIAETVGAGKPFMPTPDFVAPIVAQIIGVARRVGITTPVDPTQARMGARRVYFDASKAHRDLGVPQIDMAQSLRDAYAWYRDNGYVR